MTWTGRSAGLEFTQLRPGLQRYLATHRELTLEGLLADPPLRTGSLDVGYAGLAVLCLMVHDVAGLSGLRTLPNAGECRPDTGCRGASGCGTSGSPTGPGDSSMEGACGGDRLTRGRCTCRLRRRFDGNGGPVDVPRTTCDTDIRMPALSGATSARHRLQQAYGASALGSPSKHHGRDRRSRVRGYLVGYTKSAPTKHKGRGFIFEHRHLHGDRNLFLRSTINGDPSQLEASLIA